MGSLRDQLVKSGVADDKRARQLAHDEKARKNKLGHDGLAAQQNAAEAERHSRESRRRQEDRQREADRAAEAAARAAVAGVAQLLREHALTGGIRGPRRFHFVTAERRIPFLEVSDDAARRLEGGALAICALPGTQPEEWVVVPAELARRARETSPACVLFLNEGPAAR